MADTDTNDTNLCPCGSGLEFEACCGPYLLGDEPAPTASALMRSRYTAYAMNSIDYLYKTSGAKVRKEFDAEGSRRWAEAATWSPVCTGNCANFAYAGQCRLPDTRSFRCDHAVFRYA